MSKEGRGGQSLQSYFELFEGYEKGLRSISVLHTSCMAMILKSMSTTKAKLKSTTAIT